VITNSVPTSCMLSAAITEVLKSNVMWTQEVWEAQVIGMWLIIIDIQLCHCLGINVLSFVTWLLCVCDRVNLIIASHSLNHSLTTVLLLCGRQTSD